jgi:hypothetical protein
MKSASRWFHSIDVTYETEVYETVVYETVVYENLYRRLGSLANSQLG